MKSRIIVWSAVGLSAVLVLVLIVTTSKRVPVQKTLEDFQAQAERVSRQVDRIAAEADRVRIARQADPAATQGLEELSRLVRETRAKLDLVKSATTIREAEVQLTNAKKLVRQARRQLQLVVGKRRVGIR